METFSYYRSIEIFSVTKLMFYNLRANELGGTLKLTKLNRKFIFYLSIDSVRFKIIRKFNFVGFVLGLKNYSKIEKGHLYYNMLYIKVKIENRTVPNLYYI